MSEDLTKKLPLSDSEKLTLILTTVEELSVRVERVEASRYDTRPIWEKVVADIAHVQEGQDALRTDVGEIKKSIRDVYYRFDVLNNTMLAIGADHRDIYDRVRALENHSNPPNTQT